MRYRQMTVAVLTGLISCIAGACGASAESFRTDPDFLSESPQLCATGIVRLNNSPRNKLSEPAYLPSWAPIFPGSVLRSKGYACESDNEPYAVVTEFDAGADLSSVISFYDMHFSQDDIALKNVFEGENFKTYTISESCGVKNKVTVREVPVMNEASYVEVSVVMAVAGEGCRR